MAEQTFPDAEAVLMDWLEANLPELVPAAEGPRVDVATPANLAERLPFARVTLLGGTDDRVTDRSTLDVDVYAATRAEAFALGEAIRAGLTEPGAKRAGGRVVDYVETVGKPRPEPSGVDGVHRRLATFAIGMRRGG